MKPSKQIISATSQYLTVSLGFPMSFRHTRWAQAGNETEEWSWHRADISSGKRRMPLMHTTRFTLFRDQDGTIELQVQTTHARDELRAFLSGLEKGGPRSSALYKKLSAKGFRTAIYSAISNEREALEVRNATEARDALQIVRSSQVPWYDCTYRLLSPIIFSSTARWLAFLDETIPILKPIYWLHAFGSRYWQTQTTTKTIRARSAHTNNRLRKELQQRGETRCQNINCKTPTAFLQVAHLNRNPRYRDKLWNVLLLCANCHNQQRACACCRPVLIKSDRKTKSYTYRVWFDPRRDGDPLHWMIRSKHPVR